MCLPGTVEAVRDSQPTITRRAVLAGGGAAALAALMPGEALAHKRRRHGHHRSRGKVVDLTHTFTAGFPVYTGNAPTRRTLTTIPANGFYKQEWTFDEHSGTHMDAPGHFVAGGRMTPQLEPSELVLPIVVIDISRRAESDPDAVVDADDLRRFERRHGRIPDGALVAMDSGWAAKIGDEAGVQGRPGRRLPLPRLRRRGDRVPARPAPGGGDRRRHAEPRQRPVDHLLGARQLAQRRQLRAREPRQPRQAPARAAPRRSSAWSRGRTARAARRGCSPRTSAGAGGRPVALDRAPRRVASGRMGRAGRLVRPGRPGTSRCWSTRCCPTTTPRCSSGSTRWRRRPS